MTPLPPYRGGHRVQCKSFLYFGISIDPNVPETVTEVFSVLASAVPLYSLCQPQIPTITNEVIFFFLVMLLILLDLFTMF